MPTNEPAERDVKAKKRAFDFLMSRNGSFPSDSTVAWEELVDFAASETADLRQQLDAARAENERLKAELGKTRQPSQQVLWQRKMKAAGRCVVCGKPRKEGSASFCEVHWLKQGEVNRRRTLRKNPNARQHRSKRTAALTAADAVGDKE